MVRFSTEESRVAARFAFIVRAESTQRAASIVAKRYPGWGDLPALIEADRLRAEEEYQRGQAEVVRGALVALEWFFVAGLAKATREAGRLGSREETPPRESKDNPKGEDMHVQIVNFHLKDLSEEDYHRQCEAIASAFANLPGLVSKTWLADSETNTYGGVYVWQDRRAMEAYAETDLYKGMLANPHLDGVTARDFAVLKNPTRVTRGLTEVAA